MIERIINLPKRGLGDTTIQLLQTHARSRNLSLYAAISELIAGETLKTKVRETLTRLMQDFARWRGDLNDDNASEIAGIILDESGYVAMWQADKSPDAPGRMDNLKELVSTIADYPSLPAFLEHVALVLDNASDKNADSVALMTLHAAKGLEFDTVFLPGWEDGIFPSQRSMDESGLSGLEEERRLAYVGITRAKTRAMITFVANRRQYGSWVNNLPSRFISELPEDNIAISGQQGMAYGSQPREHHGYLPTQARDDGDTDIGLVAGARVHHDQFGSGTIIHIAGQKLDIKFDDGELRRVMAGFIDVTG
jgi:DNA helicase II / ATP-dependent DNA helicase PcrA